MTFRQNHLKSKEAHTSLIGQRSLFKGDIEAIELIEVLGKVEGNVQSSNVLSTGIESHIKGDVESQTAVICGCVDGNLYVKDSLLLKSTAKINGNIYTKTLNMENGVVFNGQCKIADVASPSDQMIKTQS